MERNRFDYVCTESEEGRDIVVIHKGEHGLVDHCAGSHVLVKTPEGEKRCWDYSECEELSRRHDEFPWR